MACVTERSFLQHCSTCILFSVPWVSAGEQFSLLCCRSSSGKRPVSWVLLQSSHDSPQVNNSVQDKFWQGEDRNGALLATTLAPSLG